MESFDNDFTNGPAAGDHRQYVLLIRANNVQQVGTLMVDHFSQGLWVFRLNAHLNGLDPIILCYTDRVRKGVHWHSTIEFGECSRLIDRAMVRVGSTTGILNFATKSEAREFIVATEPGILHQMEKAAPDKVFLPAPPEANCACNECPHMKKNTLEKVYLALRDLEPRLEMDEALLRAARVPIDRMLELSRT